ncbi:ceramide synthase 1-like [Brevipalpus obovatus]|uniref:ceramide synthase 1-like n=1 Tax=Brevipalpus obovatus TaxID=246614 RepID=UPI003D9F3CDD
MSILQGEQLWEPSPSYTQFLTLSRKFVSENFAQLMSNYTFPQDTVKDLNRCLTNLHRNDYALMLVLTLFWAITRHMLTNSFFKPVAKYYKLPRLESDKLTESAWKFLFYLGTWTFTAYIVLIKPGSHYFHQPTAVWEGYSMSLEVPKDVYAIYMIEISFYLHSLYTTLFVDQWRRDSIVLMGHHVVTSLLLVFSLSIRCHRSGLIAIFLHDACDILLEGTKSCLYFKKQDNRNVDVFEIIANIGFCMFAVTWFITRLYWFPLRNVFVSSIYVHQNGINVPFLLFLNCLLYILLIMNLYWFSFIVRLMYKVVTGQVEELEDNREYDTDFGKDAKNVDEKHVKKQLDEQPETKIQEYEKDRTATGYFLRQRKDTTFEARSH